MPVVVVILVVVVESAAGGEAVVVVVDGVATVVLTFGLTDDMLMSLISDGGASTGVDAVVVCIVEVPTSEIGFDNGGFVIEFEIEADECALFEPPQG